jgi:tight adherence protein B
VLTAVLLGIGVAAGVHPAALAIGTVAILEPRLVLAGAGVWAIVSALRRRTRPIAPDDEATYFRALAAELRAGASLRRALGEAAHRVPAVSFDRPVRFALAGAPMGDIAAMVEERFPANGRLAAAAFRLSDWSGARVADTFEGLADRAAGAAELIRERRAATAQARLSAIVVGVAPVVLALLLFASGHATGFALHGAVGLVMLGAGLTLEIAGLLVVALIVRRAER